jgi:GNAT superfamily N-acetyltransferase
MRLEIFREYPYFYHGHPAQELQYLAGLPEHAHNQLLIAKEGSSVVAMATAMPLSADRDIGKEVSEKLASAGLSEQSFYYYGEIMVYPAHRQRGIARRFYEMREEYARKLNYQYACFSTFHQPFETLERPDGYFDPAPMWQRLGYRHWDDLLLWSSLSTLSADGTEEMVHYPRAFWLKDLES